MDNDDNDAYYALALNFIKLEQPYRGIPISAVFEEAKKVLLAAPRERTTSGDIRITTPKGLEDTTMYATAIDRALHTVGVTEYSTRLAHSDPLQDIMNESQMEQGSIGEVLRQKNHDHVEFIVPAISLLPR